MAEIVGLGGICADRLLVIPRMPAWDEVEYVSSYAMQQGGMVATAVTAVARLGGQAECIGGIGADEAGQYVLNEFHKSGITTNRVAIFPQANTAQSLILVHATSGKRTILHHRGVQAHSALDVPEINLIGTRFLHLDGLWFDTALHTAQQAKAQGITITLDPSSRLLKEPRALELYRLVDYFMPGYAFATRFTGTIEPQAILDRLMALSIQAVILTKGEEGCFFQTPTTRTQIPTFQVPVVDTTGAGDAFHGAFVAGLSRGFTVVQAIEFASAVAALKCTKLGGQAGIPTLTETLAFLEAHGNRVYWK